MKSNNQAIVEGLKEMVDDLKSTYPLLNKTFYRDYKNIEEIFKDKTNKKSSVKKW